MISQLFIAPAGYQEKKGERPITLHSITDAIKEVNRLRATHQAAEHVTVYCKGGVYFLNKTMIFTPDDSLNVSFVAAPGEKPVFDGGVQLTDWKKCRLNGKTVFCAEVPEYAVFEGRIENLYVNGKPAVVASYPKFPFGKPLEIEKECVVDADSFHNGSEAFYFKNGDFDFNWYNQKGIEALVLQLWTDSHLPVKSIDEKTRLVRFGRYSAWRFDAKAIRYYWQNVREALTSPGEFYFDNTDNRVYYLPRRGEKIETLDAYVARLPLLMLLTGEPEKNRFVENLTFDGLTFRHGGAGRPAVNPDYTFPRSHQLPRPIPNSFAKDFWNTQPEGNVPTAGSPQAAAQLPGSITFFGARHCRFINCEVENTNYYAVALVGGCSDIEINGNHLHDLGAGGIVINGANVARKMDQYALATHHIAACNNHVHDCGNTYPAASAFLLGHVWANLLEHNHIHDLFYSGFSVGWSWGFGESSCRENRIGFNLIHDLGKGILCDMGGVYLLGVQPGTRVYNNYIYNVQCRIYGGWGIYCDEGSSHEVIEKNICHDCAKEGFHQHFGRETIVRDNLFVCNREHQLTITRGKKQTLEYMNPGECTSHVANIYRNILLSEGKPFYHSMFMDMMEKDQFFADDNLFWDAAPAKKRSKLFATICELLATKFDWTCTFAEWRKMGRDLHSEFADPGFVDVAKRDFHYQKNSFAKRHGFFDPAETLDHAGLEKDFEK